MNATQTETLAELIERLRSLSIDHGPKGWPAIRTRDVTALLDRIAELEAQLEAIGAGGVSGPLMGASLSANAGEPVAWLYESPMPDGSVFTGASAERLQVGVGTPPGTIEKPLYLAAPQPALSAGWVSLPGALPKPGTPVLLDIGEKYPIRAQWVPKDSLEATGDGDFGEYNEASDMYYWPEGWYEWNRYEETHWRVDETPRAWQPLPAPQQEVPDNHHRCRLLTRAELDSLGAKAEGMDGNQWDMWVQEQFARANRLKIEGGNYDWE